MTLDKLADLQRGAVKALKARRNATPGDRTEILHAVAGAFVDAREYFFTREGEPDWQGRTHAYRSWVRKTMTLAAVPAEELATLQAAIRYHTGNIVRERLSADELEDAGLSAHGPRDRAAALRERQVELLHLIDGGAMIGDPAQIETLSALILRALRRVDADAVASLPSRERAALAAELRKSAELAGQLAGAAAPARR